MFRRNNNVVSSSNEINQPNKSKDSLVTLSASERRAIGRSLRVRRRIESTIIVLIMGSLLWWIFA